MKQTTKAVVLAAGKSTRMKSAKSKIVHTILGKEIINYLLDSLASCGVADEDIIVVVGENKEEIQHVIHRRVTYTVQIPQLGTAHALLSASDFICNFHGELLVLVGDNPYITAQELQRLIDHHRRTQAACTMISALFPHKPPPYGRIVRQADNRIAAVIEEIDATPEQLSIREVNSSLYLFDNAIAFPHLGRIRNQNSKKEYYLTDIVSLLTADGYRVEAIPALDYHISIGINNKWELQEAQQKFSRSLMEKLAIEDGVTILQPDSVTIEHGTSIGIDTVIYPSVYIGSGTRIGKNCRIGPFVYLRDTVVKDGSELSFVKLTGKGE